jgi:hypothetical protein
MRPVEFKAAADAAGVNLSPPQQKVSTDAGNIARLQFSLPDPGMLGILTDSLMHKRNKHKALFIKKVIPNSQADIAGLMVQDIIEGDVVEIKKLIEGPHLVTLLVLWAEGNIDEAWKNYEGQWELSNQDEEWQLDVAAAPELLTVESVHASMIKVPTESAMNIKKGLKKINREGAETKDSIISKC